MWTMSWQKRSRSRSFCAPISKTTWILDKEGTYLIVAKWLLDLLSCSEKSKVDERGDTYTGDRTPAKLVNELKGQEEEVYPNSATGNIRTRTSYIENDN